MGLVYAYEDALLFLGRYVSDGGLTFSQQRRFGRRAGSQLKATRLAAYKTPGQAARSAG